MTIPMIEDENLIREDGQESRESPDPDSERLHVVQRDEDGCNG